MGALTFAVGIVQGLTAFSLFKGHRALYYWFALGFTAFSICSAGFKLMGKINAFPLLKLIAYLTILVILLLNSTRILFF